MWSFDSERVINNHLGNEYNYHICLGPMPISDHVIYFPFHHGKPSRRTLMENTVLSWRKVKKLNKKIIQHNQGPYNDQKCAWEQHHFEIIDLDFTTYLCACACVYDCVCIITSPHQSFCWVKWSLLSHCYLSSLPQSLCGKTLFQPLTKDSGGFFCPLNPLLSTGIRVCF